MLRDLGLRAALASDALGWCADQFFDADAKCIGEQWQRGNRYAALTALVGATLLTYTANQDAIYHRNTQKYGDKLGPTVDWLREYGMSWDDIIESSTRTGGKDLGY